MRPVELGGIQNESGEETTESPHDGRVIVVSNRLPVNLIRDEESGELQAQFSPGGLVTAMTPVLRNGRREGVWVGWPGPAGNGVEAGGLEEALRTQGRKENIRLVSVPLADEEYTSHYRRIANEVYWPLFHGFPAKTLFDNQVYYPDHKDVVDRFAATTVEQVEPTATDLVLVQDYHLFGAAEAFRARGVEAPVGFFLHIPWPSVDDWAELHPDVRTDILQGLSAYDLVGVQTRRDLDKLAASITLDLPDADIDLNTHGTFFNFEERRTRLGNYLVSIDPVEFQEVAQTDENAKRVAAIRDEFPDQTIMTGGGRSEYAKGRAKFLEGLDIAFDSYPDELPGNLTHILFGGESRFEIDAYQQIGAAESSLTRVINDKHQIAGEPWVPVVHIPRNLNREELIALYGASDIADLASLADGANLMWREYAAAGPDNGVLIGSEYAGSSEVMSALMVDPNNPEDVAEGIYKAYTMPEDEKEAHMRDLRAANGYTIFDWADNYMEDLKSVRE